ncbi:MAG: pilus assembly protein TadE [Erythrobacter sp.]|nr:pilus assembly protein TadE [Erythrobacter sp.]
MTMRSTLIRFVHDQRGAAAEFALVLPLLILFVLGTIDIGLYAWRINQAEKATQMGARWAVVTNPLANEIASTSYVNVNVGGTLITQGDRIPAGALGVLTCTSSACTCTVSPCPGTTHNPAAYAALRDTMRRVLPAIQDSNVVVEYRGSGLGFAGDPNGPDVAPIITVRLQNMTFTPVTLVLFGASVNLPDFAYSLTAEDATGTSAFF